MEISALHSWINTAIVCTTHSLGRPASALANTPFSSGQRSVTHPLEGQPQEMTEEKRQTEEVEVCQTPRWASKKFQFSVGPRHHYLNVCVYDRLGGEDKGELLIGHVCLHQ